MYGVSHLIPRTPAPGLIAPDTRFVMSLPLQVRASSYVNTSQRGLPNKEGQGCLSLIPFRGHKNQFCYLLRCSYGRHGGLMVSVLDSGASGPGSSPGRGQCVVFLGKTLYSHSASLHPGV